MKQKILGVPYDIKYKKKLDGDSGNKVSVARTNFRKQAIEMVDNAREYTDKTYWHEVIHVMDDMINIRDNGKELSESEVERLAYAISTHLREIKK